MNDIHNITSMHTFKKLSFVVTITGIDYQFYIPYYILSVGISYPEYDVNVFIDRVLHENVAKQLEVVRDTYSNFFIHIINLSDFGICDEAQRSIGVRKSIRWLIPKEYLLDYQYIYVGDVDILVCRESPNLLSQHVTHLQTLNLPVSNAIRFTTAPNVTSLNFVRLFMRNVSVFGLKTTVNNIMQVKKAHPRVTGLHFYENYHFSNNYEFARSKIICEINNIFLSKSKHFSILSSSSDEVVLFYLLEFMGINLPKVSQKYSEDPKEVNFRPTHGIHLRNFRNKPLSRWDGSIQNERKHFDYFSKNILTNPVFIRFQEQTSEVSVLVQQMINFYS